MISVLLPDVSVTGQTLEFTRDIAPPAALASPSFAATVVSDLEREASELMSGFEDGSETSPGRRAAMMARANLRLLAAELLASGDRSGAAGGVAFVRGLKLANARDAFDRMMDAGVADAGTDEHEAEARRRMSIDALESFSRGCADHVLRGAQADAHDSDDEWLSRLLSRLLPLAVTTDADAMQTHWVTLAERDQAAAVDAGAVGIALRALRLRAEASPLDEATRGNLASIVEFLERGRQFADLAARVEEHRRAINDLLESTEAIAAAAWLRDEQREKLMADIANAIERFLIPAEREAAVADVATLRAVRGVVVAASLLQRSGVDVRSLREVIETLDRDAAEAAGGHRRALNLAAMTLERMIEARTVMSGGGAGLTRELRTIDRDLQREYRTTESKVLRELAAGTLYRGSLADPNLASLLSDHRERVEDLQRLRRLPEWIAMINRMYPPAAKDFELQMRRKAADLLVPTRRPEARQAFDRFDRERAMFDQLPFEQSLRENAAAAGNLTGGLHAQLDGKITELRRAWADDWSRAQQTPGPARSLTLMRRLMEALHDSAALVEMQPDALNRWPMWQVNARIVQSGQRGVETRLQLACAAAVQGDVNTLAEQIDRLDRESPLARLAGRLMSMLGHHLLECDEGAVGVLAQLAVSPADDAALLQHREDFARISRYAAEAAHARDQRHNDAARECDEYVAALATRLLGNLAVP